MEQLQITQPKYKVYKHTAPNGKCYIGITSMRLNQRCKKDGKGYTGCRHFYAAILKYGWENFTHEILIDGLTREEAEAKEVELIAKYDSIKNGYNLNKGGFSGQKTTEETRRRISEANRGVNNSWYGKHHTEAVKKAQSEFMKGNQYNKGHHHTAEFKLMKSRQMAEKYKDGGSPRCKAVIAVKDNTSIKYYSLREAARQICVSPSRMCKVINNGIMLNGYSWRYE